MSPISTDISTAISTLVSEYDRLDGIITAPATGRRTIAMERITGAFFSSLTAQEDPQGLNHLDGDFAERTLAYSEFLSDLMVAAMLDFRQRAAQHGYSPESYQDRLQQMLEEIWDHLQQDLLGCLDSFAKEHYDQDDDGEVVGVQLIA